VAVVERPEEVRTKKGMPRLDRDNTSRLSPYLHFGCVSPRVVESRLAGIDGEGPEAFRRQLCWRDYSQLLLHFPGNAKEEFRERWFMRLLVDGDEANNNGNWQWIGSVGVDPQAVYRRIYNPALHMERHDPDGLYVRRYVPELERVPDSHLREPWTMPDDMQTEAGCVIGRHYPAPIVDRREARRDALERYDF
jgi:deoxyribodipyrimidine photolyase